MSIWEKSLLGVMVLVVTTQLVACASPASSFANDLAWQGVPGATGHIVMVGGGPRPDNLMRQILQLSPDNSMLVIPMASATPQETGDSQAAEFRALGANRVDVLLLQDPAAGNLENIQTLADQIAAAKGIWFSGGDQNRLMMFLGNGPLLQAVRTAYRNGAVISGTSAGTAVISSTMITGSEAFPVDDQSFAVMASNNVVTAPGIGLLSNMIVDQHFIMRRRLNRLISVLLDSPEFLAAGIDESTALWISADGQAEVLGESQVILLQQTDDVDSAATRATHHELSRQTDNRRLQAARDIQLSVLPPGSRFRITDTGIESIQLPAQ